MYTTTGAPQPIKESVGEKATEISAEDGTNVDETKHKTVDSKWEGTEDDKLSAFFSHYPRKIHSGQKCE